MESARQLQRQYIADPQFTPGEFTDCHGGCVLDGYLESVVYAAVLVGCRRRNRRFAHTYRRDMHVVACREGHGSDGLIRGHGRAFVQFAIVHAAQVHHVRTGTHGKS